MATVRAKTTGNEAEEADVTELKMCKAYEGRTTMKESRLAEVERQGNWSYKVCNDIYIYIYIYI